MSTIASSVANAAAAAAAKDDNEVGSRSAAEAELLASRLAAIIEPELSTVLSTNGSPATVTHFLALNAFLTTNRRAIAMMFVRLSVWNRRAL